MSEHDTKHDPRKLDDYLLGRLPGGESDALEAELLHDRRLFDLAEAAEADLLDRYVRGELATDDRKRFERHLLPSDRIRERVATARALQSWTDRQRPRRIAAGERRVTRLAWAAALIAAIAAGALGFEVTRLHDRLDDLAPAAGAVAVHVAEDEPVSDTEPLPTEPAAPFAPAADERTAAADAHRERVEQLEQELSAARERIAALESNEAESASPPAERSIGTDVATASVFLTLVTRGVETEKPLELGEARYAEIQLELGRKRPSGKVRARIIRDDVTIWDERGVEVVTEAGESMARLLLPSESLIDGRYRIHLTDETNGGTQLASYDFSVAR